MTKVAGEGDRDDPSRSWEGVAPADPVASRLARRLALADFRKAIELGGGAAPGATAAPVASAVFSFLVILLRARRTTFSAARFELAGGIAALTTIAAAFGSLAFILALGPGGAAASPTARLRLAGATPALATARLTSSATGFRGFLRIPLVRGPPLVGGAAPHAGDLAAFLFIHRREAPALPPAPAAVLVCGLAMAMGHVAVAFALFLVAGLVVLGRLPMMMSGRLVIKRRVAMVRGQAALASDLGHVGPISAHGLAPLATRLLRFLRIPLVRRASLMGRTPSFAGDLALFSLVHRRESSSLRHLLDSSVWVSATESRSGEHRTNLLFCKQHADTIKSTVNKDFKCTGSWGGEPVWTLGRHICNRVILPGRPR